MIVADAGAESTEDVALQNTIKSIKTKKVVVHFSIFTMLLIKPSFTFIKC